MATRKRTRSPARFQVGDWVQIKDGALSGAEGQVIKTLPKKIYELRQLNGNILRQPENRLKYGETVVGEFLV